jgi:lipopolysaccharide heptosyltransferase II
MIERLAAERFDAAVIFTVYSQNPLPAALLCYLAGIPLRLAHCRENPYQLLTDWVKETEPEQLVRHEVQRQLDLVSTIGTTTANRRLSVHVSQVEQDVAVALLTASGLELARPWVVLHAGATAASRRYPPEMYAEVVRGLIDQAGVQVVFTGSAGENELIEHIRSAVLADGRERRGHMHSLAGQLDLRGLAAVLRCAPLLISNNTGPVHVAAGLGTPVVVLYALTNPQHTPWETRAEVLFHDVPCKFCYKSTCPLEHNNCLRLVEPQRVVAAALSLLQGTAPTRQDDMMRVMP